MPDYTNNPKHWLDRAAETRTIAAPMIDGGIKTAMLGLATDYDKLAARAIARGENAKVSSGDL